MRYRAFIGNLVARTAAHVGCGTGDGVTDASFRRDAQGRWLIPGTSLAGALRDQARRLAPQVLAEPSIAACAAWGGEPLGSDGEPAACGCAVCHLFGDVRPSRSDDEESGGRAARLWVFDGVAHELAAPPTVRDHVGVERSTRAAARQAAAKFDVEVVPPGTSFGLRLELDWEADDDLEPSDDEILLAAVLAEWCAGRCWLGGRTARGLGAFTLERLRRVTVDLTTPDGIAEYLGADEPWQSAQAELEDGRVWMSVPVAVARGRVQARESSRSGVAGSWASFDLEVEATGALLPHDGVSAQRSGFDAAPLHVWPATDGRPVLPGASLRGAIRSRCERIARTWATNRAASLVEFGAWCPACDPLSRPLAHPEKAALASCDAFARSSPAMEGVSGGEDGLCLACLLFGASSLGSRLRVEDGSLIGEPRYVVRDFLAIDRFTGGAADGLKFDAVVLDRPRFRLQMHLDQPEPWELGWLAFMLKDLRDGRVCVGMGASKGFGRIRLAAGSIRVGFLDEAEAPLGTEQITSLSAPEMGVYSAVEVALTDTRAWNGLATPWCEAFVDRLRSYREEPSGPTREADTYFGQTTPAGSALADLYPKERVDG